MSPEKKEVFIGYPDHHARQPFTPRHTPSYAFPPPGSDIRRHGNTDFMVSGSNVYNRNAPNHCNLAHINFAGSPNYQPTSDDINYDYDPGLTFPRISV